MISTIETINQISSLAAIVLFIGGVVLLIDWYSRRLLTSLVKRYTLYGVFSLALAGSALTLIYSEIFGYAACSLCWFQRAVLYPQIVIFGTALVIKDVSVVLYGTILSGIGFLIAIYHHLLQMGVRFQVNDTELVTCSLSGGDCAGRTFMEFGFVTFPLMAAGLFFFLFALCFYRYKLERSL